MTYNIGDLVVRRCFGRYRWEMTGIIVNTTPVDDEKTYYEIRWFDPSRDRGSTTWQAHEFDLIEVAKKLDKKT